VRRRFSAIVLVLVLVLVLDSASPSPRKIEDDDEDENEHDADVKAQVSSRIMAQVRSLIEAGALRTRPIFLTSATSLLAAWPITLDPIFSGLAWALIFGLLVSTAFTLVVVPMVYYMAYRGRFQQAA
jgi:preprotein translocase subunit SecF